MKKEANTLISGFMTSIPKDQQKAALIALFNAVWREIDKRGYFPLLTRNRKQIFP